MVAILWWLGLQMLIVVVMVTIIVGMTVVMMLVMHWFHLRYGIDAARAKVMVTKPILNTVDIIIITIILIKTLSYHISSSTNLRALSARTQRLGGSLGLTNIGTSTETATYS